MAEYYLLLKTKHIKTVTINEIRFIANCPRKVSYNILMKVYQHPLNCLFYVTIKRKGQKNIYGKLYKLRKKKGKKYVKLGTDN